MENHPIPQDVTGFQFKLFGNMTVKQFAYLAAGIVLGWVFLQLPISIFIKFPLGLFFAILGISLAFLPISGRPMDAMVGNFIKALLRPTQFVYEKTGGQLYFPTTKITFSGALPFQQKDKLKTYLTTQASQNLAVSPMLMPVKPAPPAAEQPAQQPAQKKLITPSPRSDNGNIGLPSAPDYPNIIKGIVRDPRGNALANILIEVKDQEGNSVRAFKTNEFGRFASATPLLNGAYSMEFEDPKGQNKFENRTINAAGQIIQPIAAVSIDMREELRRSLFSTNN